MTKPQDFYVAAHVIIKANDKFLVLHTNKISDGTEVELWTLPGGKIDPGQNEITALNRELLEELGFDASETEPKFLNYLILDGTYKNGYKLLSLVFLIEIENEFSPNLSNEHDKFVWLAREEFFQTKFHREKILMKDILGEKLPSL